MLPDPFPSSRVGSAAGDETILENVRFLVKVVNRSYINVMRIRKTLVSCVKLGHALYSINYSIVSLKIDTD